MRLRRLLVGLAAVALPLVAIGASPALADPTDIVQSGRSGSDRLCVGVEDPDGSNTTWVCSPEAQWYGQVIEAVLSLTPA